MLTSQLQDKLIRFGHALLDQQRARVIVPPQDASTGFWFGGGNMIQADNGALYVVGRYRNHGDSRTGIASGTRGLELAIFQSTDRGGSWKKVASWSKEDLSLPDRPVLSIEGSAIRKTDRGYELLVSTEKDHVGYPDDVADYLKPGTGVWSIDRLQAESIEELPNANVEPFLESRAPENIHIKDPFVVSGSTHPMVLFCSHPFNWSSSNTGFWMDDDLTVYDFFPRGPAWDVAMTRGTAILDVPQIGAFEKLDVSLLFYDGGECLRNLDAHENAVERPRGYSCEELGGLAYFTDGDLGQVQRLSLLKPMFISPYGTGCSRYVDVLPTEQGFYTTWQQSQEDLSQPLVMTFLSSREAEAILR